MILDGLSLGFFSLLSCLIPLCHFITCPQPAFLNDTKPGMKAENVFFFLFCKRQEITHELRSTQQRTENCSWVSAGARIARKVPRSQHSSLSQGRAPLLLHLLFPPWGFCSSSLENCTVFLCFSGFPEATHLLLEYYWGAIPFLLPHLPHGPEATQHHVKEKLLSFCFFKASSIQGCSCAPEMKQGIIFLASKAVCVHWGVHL